MFAVARSECASNTVAICFPQLHKQRSFQTLQTYCSSSGGTGLLVKSVILGLKCVILKPNVTISIAVLASGRQTAKDLLNSEIQVKIQRSCVCTVCFAFCSWPLTKKKKKKKLRKNKTKIRPQSLSCLVWAQKNICREQGARSAGHRFTLTMSQHQQRNLDIRLCFYLKIQMPLSSFSAYNPLPEHSTKYMSIYITYEQKY